MAADDGPPRSRIKRLGWFVALWTAGVLAVACLGDPVHDRRMIIPVHARVLVQRHHGGFLKTYSRSGTQFGTGPVTSSGLSRRTHRHGVRTEP